MWNYVTQHKDTYDPIRWDGNIKKVLTLIFMPELTRLNSHFKDEKIN